MREARAEVLVEAGPDSAGGATTGAGAALGDLGGISAHLEAADAHRVVSWAVGWFGRDLVVTSAFQDCVLIDLAVRADAGVQVVFLDTGFHFPETLQYLALVRRRYDLNLRVVQPRVGLGEHPCGSGRCCEVRKVEPLQEILARGKAWMTGIRRTETPGRATTPVVGVDRRTGAVKVSPLAHWSASDVSRYEEDHHLPVHPLRARGYTSIGCAPTTAPVAAGKDPRSGRWPGEEKTECGLHS